MNCFYRKSNIFIRKCITYSQIKHFLTKLKSCAIIPVRNYSLPVYRKKMFNSTNVTNYRLLSSESDDIINDDAEEDIVDFLPYDELMQPQPVRNILHPNLEDLVILKLNESASIQDVFNFITEHSEELQPAHVAHVVLLLWDLQKMFFYAHQINRAVPDDKVLKNYISDLINHDAFSTLLQLIERNCNNFDLESLSCVLLYLNKMGLSVNHQVLQLLITRMQHSIEADISLSALSRFIVTVLSEYNLRSFFITKDAVPIVMHKLEKCESAEDLKLITICLNHLQHVITNDLLEKYIEKVRGLLDNNLLTSKNYRTLLKSILFLSSPRWGDRNTTLVSKMMLMLKNNLHLLGVLDFFIAYEVLYKNHEPGELLTEMQRCASRILHHMEEDSSLSPEVRLKLLSCLVCFSSPLHRPDYEKMIAKLVKDPLTKFSLFDFLRILTFIKPSDSKLCEAFWDNALQTIVDQEIFKDVDMLLKLCQKYMNYSSDVNYRHTRFEQQMVQWLYDEIENGIIDLIPSKLSMAAAFIFAYGSNEDVISQILQKITNHWEQLNHADCLYISKGIRSIIETTKNPLFTTSRLHKINRVLDKCITNKLITLGDTSKVNFLVKSCIYRKQFDRTLINKLLLTFNSDQKLSSNSIRNIVFSLQATNGLLPDIIDSISDYVIMHRDNLLGFNAEKIAYLCFHLAYLPKNSNELFQAITDVIIRDQERISGLSYIQAALSLCFFNKLPDSFIKQIFNVAFLEKLDTELATCYFKDVYPVRVRHSMMQLNRAVCLDYPQANVPWFHQKYIDQLRNKAKGRIREIDAIAKIKAYLLEVVKDPDYLLQDVDTAYGYHIDFVIHVDSDGQLVKSTENNNGKKLAILIMRSSAYTNINVQLRGQYQLKKRHLEILGYQVEIVNLNDWNSLVYGEEKLDYLNKLIWPCCTSRLPIVER